jgi:hypothetical protein
MREDVSMVAALVGFIAALAATIAVNFAMLRPVQEPPENDGLPWR